MAASLILVRTKPNGVADPDPRLGVFIPPTGEIFKPSSQAGGVRYALVFTAPTFTATVNIYAQDQQTKSWYLVATKGSVGHRVLKTQCNTGAHDLWIGLADIVGGAPIKIYMEEVD